MLDLGMAAAIDAQAFGEPGQRTFRLRVIGAGDHSASLWMEKEQFQALNLAFAQVLAQLNFREEAGNQDLSQFVEHPDYDFRVGRIALGFDPADRTVVLDTYDATSGEDETDPTLRVRLSQGQCASLVAQLSDIITKGRPVCPLCGVAMEATGHVCVRANGHSKQPIPEDRSGEVGDEEL